MPYETLSLPLVQKIGPVRGSNALRVGDHGTVELGTVEPSPRTINIIVLINQALTASAMVEAIQIATEGRVTAVGRANIKGVISHGIATGTGTDCIVVAAPDHPAKHVYCGKHTRLGELIGRAVIRGCTRALARRELAGTPLQTRVQK